MIRDDRIAPDGYTTPVYHDHATTAPLLKRISWSAILAGVVLAMVVSLLLNLLGTAIGTATIVVGLQVVWHSAKARSTVCWYGQVFR